MNESTDTRTALLDAARHLFAMKGYDGTSIKDITTRAGANLGAVTYHFGTKDALYTETLRSLTEPLAPRIGVLKSKKGTPLERIEQYMRGYFTYLAQNPELPSMLFQELALHRQIPDPIKAVMRPMFGLLAANISEGQEEGSIITGDPVLLALSVIAQPAWIIVMREALHEVAGLEINKPETRERVLEHIIAVTHRNLTNPAGHATGGEGKGGSR
ncbi:MAG: TetR/AcrR family transcriptional regulator [Candidatus Zixiibacteriota bacterium]